jgi:hypothetical protein
MVSHNLALEKGYDSDYRLFWMPAGSASDPRQSQGSRGSLRLKVSDSRFAGGLDLGVSPQPP